MFNKKTTPVQIVAPTPANKPIATDYSSTSLVDLLGIKKAVDTEFEKRRQEVYGNVTAQLETFGLSLDDMKPVRKKRVETPPRYRDPENPEQTWSGRGKPSKWMQAYLDAGRSKEEFEVAA